ncbi:MAG: nucleotidyltransferase domain-containing protein [Chloroflexota bacterium]|nr:nucleotidyltransferase domain-containing protein [Chloroflexota bacterium]
MSRPSEDLRRTYEEALTSFVAKVQQDRSIIAAILYGSLAYDDVWEKSDIDILLVSRENKIAHRYYSLVENGISIQVHMGTRSNFRAMIERSLQGSFTHSLISRSTLLFSSDDSIQDYYRNSAHVGSKDREYQLLKVAADILPVLTKAEKWLYVKKDPIYSFLWLMFLINHLAAIEVLLHNDVAMREVVQQALTYNPAFFTKIYLDLVQRPKDEETMRQAIQLVHDYLGEKLPLLFKPILTYLTTASGARTATELNAHLRQKLQMEGDALGYLAFAYEWLADKGVIRKVSSPVRLTEKSRITVDEAAYYYDGGDAYATNDSH